MKLIIKTLFHFLINVITIWLFAIKVFISNTLVKILVLGIAAFLVVLPFINPSLFNLCIAVVLPGAYLLCCLVSAIKIAVLSSYGGDNTYSETRENLNNQQIHMDSLFSGMGKEAATKEYRRLLKIYHPDNPETGNAEITQNIIEKYQTMFG